MKVEVKYITEDAKLLAPVAENIAQDIADSLKSLSKEIDKAGAKITLHFGKDSKVEINHAPQTLHDAILKQLKFP